MRRLLADRRGVASVVAAVGFAALMISAAVGVDAGAVYLDSRQLQGEADLAAMAAAENLGSAAAAAGTVVSLNGWPAPVSAQVTLGAYTPDPAAAAGDRFRAGPAGANAVQVSLSGVAPLPFGGWLLGKAGVPVTRTATAAVAQLASFTLGTRLAALQGGIANSILSAATSSQVQLSVLDYNALLSAKLDLFQYLAALQTRAGLQGGSYSQVLNTSLSAPVALNALADVLTANGQASAAAAARALAAAGATAPPVRLANLFDLGPYLNQDHVAGASSASISLDALDLADATLMLAPGARELSLDLGAAAPGLGGVHLWLALGQPAVQSPWLTVTADGSAEVRTAQGRVYLDATLAPSALGALGLVSLDVPVFVQLASAEARLSAIDCPAASAAGSLTLSVTPGIGELALGKADPLALPNFSQNVALAPAPLLTLPLVSITGAAETDLGGAAAQTVGFTSADIAAMTVKTVSTTDAAQASIASLLSTARIQVSVAGLGVGLVPGALSSQASAVLVGAGASLDQVLDAVESVAGVRLGQADVWVDGLRCNGAALVG